VLGLPEFDGVADFDKSCYGLQEVRVETWGPFVFVNLDPAAAPLATTLGQILDETAHIPLAAMRPVERRDYVIACNWKVSYTLQTGPDWVSGRDRLTDHLPRRGPGL